MDPLRRRALWLLLPIWAACFGLAVRDTVTPTAYPPVALRYHQHGFPVVLGARSAESEHSGLAPGDALLRWGDTSLRGAGETVLFAAVARATTPRLTAHVLVLRGGRELALEVRTASYARFWPRLPAAVVFLVVGVLLWRRARDELTQTFVTMLWGGAFLFVCTFAGPAWLVAVASVVQAAGVSTLTVYGLKGMFLFPHGHRPRSRLLRALPWVCVVLGPLDVERTRGFLVPQQAAHQLSFAVYALVFGALVVDSAVKYRRSDPVERRKIKWVLWGTFVAALLPAVTAVIALFSPGSSLSFYVAVASLAIIPICLLIAIDYYNLFDINRLISATFSLGLLAFCGLSLAFWALPRVALLARNALPVSESLAQLLAASCVALCVIGFHRRVQPLIERVLFAERGALQRGMLQLVSELEHAASAGDLLRHVTERLRLLLKPDTIVLYLRGATAFESVIAHGAVIAPALPAESGLAAGMRGQAGALSFERGSRLERPPVDAPGMALIDTLDARVVLPFRRGSELIGMLCVGAKGSGDLFVPSDVALLGSLASLVSHRLAGLELDALLREAREAQAALERYVPGAVAQELASGAELVPGERELTLLFVDIRGYSSFAEGRSASEVFSRISAYTRDVSAIAREHAGHVVEFNGDGMMVVFGAPRPLAHKERAAVEAGLAIIEHMTRGGPQREPRLAVGVGIATGPAFVGNIRAVDRMIWTAIGETTNRAARLQALTRELGASMVVDEPTFAALPRADARFVSHRGMRLRGHARIQTLFALPLPPAAVPAPMAGLAEALEPGGLRRRGAG